MEEFSDFNKKTIISKYNEANLKGYWPFALKSEGKVCAKPVTPSIKDCFSVDSRFFFMIDNPARQWKQKVMSVLHFLLVLNC